MVLQYVEKITMERYFLQNHRKQVHNKKTHSKWKMASICLFFGVFGLHRFVLGYSNWWLMQCTVGGFGIWVLVDLVRILNGSLISGHAKDLTGSGDSKCLSMYLI